MRIIGIDPGTAITGFSILEKTGNSFSLLDYGVIRTSSKTQLPERLSQISEDIRTLIKKWEPQKASIEKLFFNKNVKTAISVAHARGVIMQIFAEKGIYTEEHTPSKIKASVCGYGKADKKAVQQMTKILLNLNEIPQPDDAADAIAVAICSLNTSNFNE